MEEKIKIAIAIVYAIGYYILMYKLLKRMGKEEEGNKDE